jgi:hypothetical protein
VCSHITITSVSPVFKDFLESESFVIEGKPKIRSGQSPMNCSHRGGTGKFQPDKLLVRSFWLLLSRRFQNRFQHQGNRLWIAESHQDY